MGEVIIGIAAIVAVLIAIVLYVITQYLHSTKRRDLEGRVFSERKWRKQFEQMFREQQAVTLTVREERDSARREAGTAGKRLGEARQLVELAQSELVKARSKQLAGVDQLQAELADCRQELAESLAYNAGLSEQLADTRDLLEASDHSFQQLVEAADTGLDKLTAERDAARERVATVTEERDMAKSDARYGFKLAGERDDENGQLHVTLEQVDGELAETRADLAEAGELLAAEVRTTAWWEQAAKSAKERIGELKEELAGTEQELVEARSWKDRALNSEQKYLKLSSNHEDVCRWLDEAREELEKSQQEAGSKLEQAWLWVRNYIANTTPEKSELKGCACWPACRVTPFGGLPEDYLNEGKF